MVVNLVAVEHSQCRCYNLLGSDSRNESHVEFPVESLCSEHRFYCLSYASYVALLLLFAWREALVVWEISECPDYYACHENYSSHLSQILLSLLPCVSEYGFRRRKPVWRQLHDKGCVVALHKPSAEHAAHYYRHDYADDVERNHHCALIFNGEESACQHDVYRQSGRAAHHRQYEHRDQSRALAFHSSCRHHRRHIASEAHDERYERLSVQPHLVHQAVHDERRPRHVARVLHERDEGVENQYLWQEDYHRPHAAYYSVDNHVLQHSVGHVVCNHVAQESHAGLYPVHRILSERERHLEHQVE